MASTHAARIAQAVAYAREQRLTRQQPIKTPLPSPVYTRIRPKPTRLVPLAARDRGGRGGKDVRQQQLAPSASRIVAGQPPELPVQPERPPQPATTQPDRLPQPATTRPVPPELEEHFRAEYRAARGDFGPLVGLGRQADQRDADARDAEREQRRASAEARRPSWWPKELKIKPPERRRRPPSPTTVAAADTRLREIRRKLEAGHELSKDEENDAKAILELKQIWADARVGVAAAPTEKALPTRTPLIGHQGLALPVVTRLGRGGGLDAAECMTHM